MNKLEQYREQEADKEYPSMGEDSNYCDTGLLQNDSFKSGFDAAIALELPVKFANWKNEVAQQLEYHPLLQYDTNEKLFQYWLNNVYKFE